MFIERKIDLYAYFNVPRPHQNAKGYIDAYIIERSNEFTEKRLRPAMIVFPGGGYWMRSDREKEPIALAYLNQGFDAFTVEYSVGSECEDAHFPIMLIEACMAVAFVKENAERYNIIKDKIAIIGFSAGGHLAGSCATMYDDKVVLDALKEKASLARPDVAVLSYPVVTFSKATHGGTRDWATGKNPDLYEELSVENRVTETTPPMFIWATYEDQTVPVINSILLAKALTEHKVPFDLHIYRKGCHGLSLASQETAKEGDSRMIEPIAEDWFIQSVKFLKQLGFTVCN